MTEKFFIDGPSGRIAALLDTPEGKAEGKLPLAVYCHGIMDSKTGIVGEFLSKAVPSAGIALLRFDFDGHGESEGPSYEMTIPSELDDLRAVLSYARTLPWVDGIALIGHSLGGVVAAMVAGEEGFPSVRALLLYAPAGNVKADASRGYVVGGRFNPLNVPERIPLLGDFILGKDYILTVKDLPIHETASLYKGPALIIHGRHDIIVPPREGERFRDVIEGSEMILMERSRHDFALCRDEAGALGAGWLRSTLLGKEQQMSL